jgi:hypothetical protein
VIAPVFWEIGSKESWASPNSEKGLSGDSGMPPARGKRGVAMREPHPEPSFVFKCEEAIVAVAKLLRADPVARELEAIAKLIDGLEKPEDVAAAERIHFALVGLTERVQKWRDVFAAKQK